MPDDVQISQSAPDTPQKDGGKKSADNSFVRFGRKIVINTKSRLPQFDNGKSQAYAAHEDGNQSNVYIALVCGVEALPRWSTLTPYDALAETSFIRLVGSGIVSWPAEGRQKFVLMYMGGMGEPIVPKGGFSATQWRHPDIVENLVHPMVRILREMEDKNFVHGAIRPDNIFYASAGNKDNPIILGDCLGAQPHSTQPNIFLPIGKMLTHPMGRGRGTNADDIYAFGVSLLMFLRKNDETAGVDDHEILRRKVELGSYAALIGGERFQASFLELLRGLLHDDPALRWGTEEILSWLDGTRQTPPPYVKRKKANRPFTIGGKKYFFADSLALDIHKSPADVVAAVNDGSLARWINKSIDDSNLHERFERAVTRLSATSGNTDYLISQLRMGLFPELPIHYKDVQCTYNGLGGVLAEALVEEGDTQPIKEVFNLNLVDHALAATRLQQAEIMALLKTYDACRSALKQKRSGYGIDRCLYILFNEAPCLSPKLKGFFITGHQTALKAFETLCEKGGQTALFFDKYLIAFFSAVNPSVMERCLYDILSTDKSMQVQGNLRYFAVMQQRAKGEPVPAIAGVFLESLAGCVKAFKSRPKREKLAADLEKAAKKGDVTAMSDLLDDENARIMDDKGFALASAEYNQLQKEYNEYNKRLANKKTYGVVNGHDAATAVSWTVATLINMIIVFAYLSGYRVY